ncbi:MAG TPA: hypothetical protein VM901_05560 [Bdellovibrionota bacterium]|jgi:hypothetical protein|nr:hypothetical protein [Bdellovibrionota bacterium]
MRISVLRCFFLSLGFASAAHASLFIQGAAFAPSAPRYLYFWAYPEQFPAFLNDLSGKDEAKVSPESIGLYLWDLRKQRLQRLPVDKVWATFTTPYASEISSVIFYTRQPRGLRFYWNGGGLEVSPQGIPLSSDDYPRLARQFSLYPDSRLPELQAALEREFPRLASREFSKTREFFYSTASKEIPNNVRAPRSSPAPRIFEFGYRHKDLVLLFINHQVDKRKLPLGLNNPLPLLLNTQTNSYHPLHQTSAAITMTEAFYNSTVGIEIETLPSRSLDLHINSHALSFWDPVNPTRAITFRAIPPSELREIEDGFRSVHYWQAKAPKLLHTLRNYEFYSATGFPRTSGKPHPMVAIERDREGKPLRAMIGGNNLFSDFDFDWIESEFTNGLAGSLRMRHRPETLEMDPHFAAGRYAAAEVWIPAAGISAHEVARYELKPYPYVRTTRGTESRLHAISVNTVEQQLGVSFQRRLSTCRAVLETLLSL